MIQRINDYPFVRKRCEVVETVAPQLHNVNIYLWEKSGFEGISQPSTQRVILSHKLISNLADLSVNSMPIYFDLVLFHEIAHLFYATEKKDSIEERFYLEVKCDQWALSLMLNKLGYTKEEVIEFYRKKESEMLRSLSLTPTDFGNKDILIWLHENFELYHGIFLTQYILNNIEFIDINLQLSDMKDFLCHEPSFKFVEDTYVE